MAIFILLRLRTSIIAETGKDYDRLNNLFPYQYDVGVDNNNYTPISWKQVQEKIAYQVEHCIPTLEVVI